MKSTEKWKDSGLEDPTTTNKNIPGGEKHNLKNASCRSKVVAGDLQDLHRLEESEEIRLFIRIP